jgi:hypothetical protein
MEPNLEQNKKPEQVKLEFDPKPEIHKRTNAELAQSIREKRALSNATGKPLSFDPEEIAFMEYQRETDDDLPYKKVS